MSRKEEVQNFYDNGDMNWNTAMAGFSLDAVDHAEGLGYALDYSEESLKNIEEILEQMHRTRPRGLFRFIEAIFHPGQFNRTCKRYGGYIGEVMRFEWGEGEWNFATEGLFAGYYTFHYGESTISPQIRVAKRLTNGATDNIVDYYNALKDRRNRTPT